MDSEITIQPPLTLHGFCESVFQEYSKNWPPTENVIATDFVSFLKIDTFLTPDKLQQLCETLGVIVRFQELPKGIRGFNHTYQNKREIVIGNIGPRAVLLGSREHTLLHELREQIEYEFRKAGHPTTNDADKEERAELFAISVRNFASARAMLDIYQDAIPNAKSGWVQVGLIVLLIVGFFA